MDYEPNTLSEEWAIPVPPFHGDATPDVPTRPPAPGRRRLGLYAGQIVIAPDFEEDISHLFSDDVQPGDG
jgi:hypothetical protein